MNREYTNEPLTTVVRYTVIADDFILTNKGFRPLDRLNTSSIKLFISPYAIREYFENNFNNRKYKVNYQIKKIKVIYEVLD